MISEQFWLVVEVLEVVRPRVQEGPQRLLEARQSAEVVPRLSQVV